MRLNGLHNPFVTGTDYLSYLIGISVFDAVQRKAMTLNKPEPNPTRRKALAAGLAGFVLITIGRTVSVAEGDTSPVPTYSEQFQKAYDAIVGTSAVGDTGVTIELPEVAENGNFVPVTMSIDSPMTAQDHITAIYILSTANPIGLVATFHLSPLNGIARIQSRMRLAKSQDVMVIAQKSDGSLTKAVLPVSVTIGGCQT